MVAVDFDEVLCKDAWPDIGEPRESIITLMKWYKQAGWKLILWTCRSGKRLADAVIWCEEHGLKFDAVNENLPEVIEKYDGVDSRKITATIYIDDRAVTPNGMINMLGQVAAGMKEEK